MVRPDELVAHARFVRAVARDLVRAPDVADDVAQSTLLIGLERPPRSREGLMAWIVSVVRSVTATLGRRDQARRAHEPSAAVREAQPSTLDVVAHEEIVRRVVDVVFELDEPYRSAILLRYYEDLKPGAIARRLEVPVETVRTRLKRGLARMRERLDEGSGGGRDAWAAALTGALRLRPRVAAPLVVKAAVALFVVGGASLLAWRLHGASRRTDSTAAASSELSAQREPLAASESGEPARSIASMTPSPPASEPVDPAFLVRGTVVDEDERPIAGARVWVLERDNIESVDCPPHVLRDLVVHGYRGDSPPTTVTGSDGAFSIAGLPLRTNLLLFEADGFDVRTTYSRPCNAMRELLARCEPLHGVVLDELSGVPLADVGVVLGHGGMDGGNTGRWARTVTARDGSFAFTKSCRSRSVTLTLDRPGCMPVPVKCSVTSDGEVGRVTARWPRSSHLAGKVVDDATGAAIADATICFFDDVWYSLAGWEPADAGFRRVATTDANGEFGVGIAADGARAVVVAARHLPRTVTLPAPAEDGGVVTFRLDGAPQIAGEVHGPDGALLSDVRVFAVTRGAGLNRVDPRLVGVSGRPRRSTLVTGGSFATSDADGRFVLDGVFDEDSWSAGLDEFQVRVIAHDPRFGKGNSEVATVRFSDSVAHVAVRFDRERKRRVVAGRLLAGGRGIAGSVRCEAGGESYDVDTSDGGEFAFEVDASVAVVNLFGIPHDFRMCGDESSGVRATAHLTADAPTRHDLEVRGRRDTISGTVVDEDGRPVAKDVLRAFLRVPDGPMVFSERTTDANGEYSFDLLDVYGDRFEIAVAHGAWTTSRFDIPLGAKDVDFVVPTLGAIRLIVRNRATGESVHWPSIATRGLDETTFTSHDSSDGRRQLADQDDAIELELPLGTYALEVLDIAGRLDPVAVDRVVAADPPGNPIVVEMTPTPVVRMNVVNDDARPLSSHFLFLLHDAEWGRVHARLNDQRGWEVWIDRGVAAEQLDLLSREVEFDAKSTTVQVRATAGRYRLFVQPDDLVVEPAELEVRADAIEPVEVHFHRRPR